MTDHERVLTVTCREDTDLMRDADETNRRADEGRVLRATPATPMLPDTPLTGSHLTTLLHRRRTRRGVLGLGVGVVATALLAACGGDDDDDAATPTATSAAAAPSTATAAPAEPTATSASVAPTATTAAASPTTGSDAGAAGDAGDAVTYPLTITHAMGEATLPALPQRIVAVNDAEHIDTLLAIGLKPVLYGYSGSYGVERSPWVSAADLEGIEFYDNTARMPDIELIAAARPDLILDVWTDPTVYTQLAAVAPTLVMKADDLTPWQDLQRMVGLATDRVQASEDVIAETEALLDAQAERLLPYVDRPVMIGYQFFEEIIIHGKNTTVGALLTRLGMTVTAPDDDELTFVSLERWSDLAGADLLVSLSFFDEDSAAQETDPLFQSLPAVQDGRYSLFDNRMARALYLESALGLRWVTPLVVDALIEAAEGRGRTL